MNRIAQLNITVNGKTYSGEGESIAQAARELERAVAGAETRWMVTPEGARVAAAAATEAYLDAPTLATAARMEAAYALCERLELEEVGR